MGIGTASPRLPLQINAASAAPASSGNASGHLLITGGGTYATVFGTVDSTSQYSWIQGQYSDNAGVTRPIALQPVGGNVGIGTTTPVTPLHVVSSSISDIRSQGPNYAKFSFNSSSGGTNQKKWQLYSDASLNALSLGALNDLEDGQQIALQINRGSETAISSVSFPNGSVVIGGTATKQSAHGPEKLSLQDTDSLKVAIGAFVVSDPNPLNARFLLDMNGNHEWSNDGSDQTVVLGCIDKGRMNLVGFPKGSSAGGGLGIVAWKWSKLTFDVSDTQTTFTVDDPTQFTTNERIRVDNEICKITMIAGSTLTVDRGQEGTAKASHTHGAVVVAIGTEEAPPRILFLNDGGGIAFSDGTNATDVSISRPAANQILINGNLATGRANITLSNADNADIGLLGATFVKVTGPSAAFAVTGFAGGSDGRILLLYNTTSQTMTIKYNNAASAVANRILTLTGGDVSLRSGQSFATFIYDVDQGLWVLAATN